METSTTLKFELTELDNQSSSSYQFRYEELNPSFISIPFNNPSLQSHLCYERLYSDAFYTQQRKDKLRDSLEKQRIESINKNSFRKSHPELKNAYHGDSIRSGDTFHEKLYNYDMEWVKRRDEKVAKLHEKLRLEKEMEELASMSPIPSLMTSEFNEKLFPRGKDSYRYCNNLSNVHDALYYSKTLHDNSLSKLATRISDQASKDMYFIPKINDKSSELAGKRRLQSPYYSNRLHSHDKSSPDRIGASNDSTGLKLTDLTTNCSQDEDLVFADNRASTRNHKTIEMSDEQSFSTFIRVILQSSKANIDNHISQNLQIVDSEGQNFNSEAVLDVIDNNSNQMLLLTDNKSASKFRKRSQSVDSRSDNKHNINEVNHQQIASNQNKYKRDRSHSVTSFPSSRRFSDVNGTSRLDSKVLTTSRVNATNALFNDLYHARDNSLLIMQEAKEKYIPSFPFKPDIGVNSSISVESDQKLFVKRLYDYRNYQSNYLRKLTNKVVEAERGYDKKPMKVNSKQEEQKWIDRLAVLNVKSQQFRQINSLCKAEDQYNESINFSSPNIPEKSRNIILLKKYSQALNEIYDILVISMEIPMNRQGKSSDITEIEVVSKSTKVIDKDLDKDCYSVHSDATTNISTSNDSIRDIADMNNKSFTLEKQYRYLKNELNQHKLKLNNEQVLESSISLDINDFGLNINDLSDANNQKTESLQCDCSLLDVMLAQTEYLNSIFLMNSVQAVLDFVLHSKIVKMNDQASNQNFCSLDESMIDSKITRDEFIAAFGSCIRKEIVPYSLIEYLASSIPNTVKDDKSSNLQLFEDNQIKSIPLSSSDISARVSGNVKVCGTKDSNMSDSECHTVDCTTREGSISSSQRSGNFNRSRKLVSTLQRDTLARSYRKSSNIKLKADATNGNFSENKHGNSKNQSFNATESKFSNSVLSSNSISRSKTSGQPIEERLIQYNDVYEENRLKLSMKISQENSRELTFSPNIKKSQKSYSKTLTALFQ